MANILIVDDDTDLLWTMTSLLELKGHAIMSATNGNEGLELAGRFFFDLVISDIVMPESLG